jgi:arylsulfatase A-like enzyme
MPRALLAAGAAAVLAAGAPLLVASVPATQLPNILILVADDLGATDVSWRGSEFPTPNIDALAVENGLRLENYYVQLVCSPTRTAVLTGRYPLHTGLQHIVIWQDVAVAIDHEHPTIAETLRDSYGYNSSYAIGKWHAGHAAWNNTPPARGFEGGWYGWNGGSADYYEHVIGAQAPGHTFTGEGFTMFDGLGTRAGVPDPVGRPEALPVPAWADKGNYSTELWADKAIDIIGAHNFDRDPFFMYLAFQSPHAPVQACPDEEINAACAKLTKGEGRDVFCSMVTYVGSAARAPKRNVAYLFGQMRWREPPGPCVPERASLRRPDGSCK